MSVTDGGDLLRGAASSRAARILLWVYLALTLVSKVADANAHPDLWHVPWVLACYALPIWWLSGWQREPWERAPWALLMAQAIVSYLPLVLFGSGWVGGVDGLLGALVLLLLRSPTRWWLFAGLAVIEVVAWFLVGLPYAPAVNATTWILVAYLNLGLGLYGMATAPVLLERLESTAELLADAAVDRQRLTVAQELQVTITRRLDDIRRNAESALATPGIDDARRFLTQVGLAARAAAVSARRMVPATPASTPASEAGRDLSPRIAFRIVAAVVVLLAAQYLVNTIMPVPGGGEPTFATTLAAITIAVVMVVLQLRHSRPNVDRRPAGWAWTLALQAVLCFALYPVFGVVSMGLLAFVGGSALLLITGSARWLVYGATVASVPLLALREPADLAPEILWQWSIYAAATMAAAGLLFFGLGRLPATATRLAEARRSLVDAATTRERVRLIRDTHDTLGLTLSTIALKTDLAEALLDGNPVRARREIVQALHLAQTVATDADSIVTGTLRLSLSTELTTARDALRAAGTTLLVQADLGGIPTRADAALAAVLRETIANVLRHSDASACTIRLYGTADSFSIAVTNNAAREPATEREGGHGLANIRSRIAALGGELDVKRRDDVFTLTASVPRTLVAAPGEPDHVEVR
ncbi:sensor histidine kinase [Microbacterium dextranolyticum]|uniref:Signal transduction histidine kinase subgroup 3 dimerisation and phosphoacceptor domain-containing protein n=1 Tax=Microbacterium dextranolyticum TaxID=36806 RepID=A0A9W6M782_9MICO|nr:histidine kinase [Microbacterium dextranolyticum]MBM7462547.1 two-component system sensor histidine kinase DesK [Microbacterium dextranolyticum]GLJ96405.1 hypothetical protein GCM10017591_24680 [Microbacterium dextranolyticum]